jgi:hypothetical protein
LQLIIPVVDFVALKPTLLAIIPVVDLIPPDTILKPIIIVIDVYIFGQGRRTSQKGNYQH